MSDRVPVAGDLVIVRERRPEYDSGDVSGVVTRVDTPGDPRSPVDVGVLYPQAPAPRGTGEGRMGRYPAVGDAVVIQAPPEGWPMVARVAQGDAGRVTMDAASGETWVGIPAAGEPSAAGMYWRWPGDEDQPQPFWRLNVEPGSGGRCELTRGGPAT